MTPATDWTKALASQVAAAEAPSYSIVAKPYGAVQPGGEDHLWVYPLLGKSALVASLVAKHGYQVAVAGPSAGQPDLLRKNYDSKTLIVWEAAGAEEAGLHGHAEYAASWRRLHELAHALTKVEVDSAYGDGRVFGRLGKSRTLRESLRAVHWEHLAIHRQRELTKSVGAEVSDQDFGREYNAVMHDAVHRALTGTYSDAAREGFSPSSSPVPLQRSLDILRAEARRLGLAGWDALQRGPVVKAEPFGRARSLLALHNVAQRAHQTGVSANEAGTHPALSGAAAAHASAMLPSSGLAESPSAWHSRSADEAKRRAGAEKSGPAALALHALSAAHRRLGQSDGVKKSEQTHRGVKAAAIQAHASGVTPQTLDKAPGLRTAALAHAADKVPGTVPANERPDWHIEAANKMSVGAQRQTGPIALAMHAMSQAHQHHASRPTVKSAFLAHGLEELVLLGKSATARAVDALYVKVRKADIESWTAAHLSGPKPGAGPSGPAKPAGGPPHPTAGVAPKPGHKGSEFLQDVAEAVPELAEGANNVMGAMVSENGAQGVHQALGALRGLGEQLRRKRELAAATATKPGVIPEQSAKV